MSPLNTDDLHRIFKNLDQNGDGFVSLAELELLLERIGMQSTQEDLESVVGKTNLDLLGFESLYDSIVKRKIGGENQDGPDDEERENDLVEAFKVYDQDGDGFISCEELERVLKQLGFPNENASQDCNTMIDTYDMNSDGVLDFEEFKKKSFEAFLSRIIQTYRIKLNLFLELPMIKLNLFSAPIAPKDF